MISTLRGPGFFLRRRSACHRSMRSGLKPWIAIRLKAGIR